MPDIVSALMGKPSEDDDLSLLEALSPGGQRYVAPNGPTWLRAAGKYVNDQFVSPFYKAVTAPGDAYSGRMQVMDPATGMPSQEAIDRTRDLAMNMTLGSGAFEGGTVNAGATRRPDLNGMRAYEASPSSGLEVERVGQHWSPKDIYIMDPAERGKGLAQAMYLRALEDSPLLERPELRSPEATRAVDAMIRKGQVERYTQDGKSFLRIKPDA